MVTPLDALKATSPAESASLPASRVRRPYVAPELRRLGSVRELTLGTSNKALEGGQRNM